MAGYLKRLSDWHRDVTRDVTMKMMGVPIPEKPEEKKPNPKVIPKVIPKKKGLLERATIPYSERKTTIGANIKGENRKFMEEMAKEPKKKK